MHIVVYIFTTYLTSVEIQVDVFEINPLHEILWKVDIRHYALLRNLCVYIPIPTDKIRFN